MKKRLFSIFVMLCMILTCIMPCSVFAAAAGEWENIQLKHNGDGNYTLTFDIVSGESCSSILGFQVFTQQFLDDEDLDATGPGTGTFRGAIQDLIETGSYDGENYPDDYEVRISKLIKSHAIAPGDTDKNKLDFSLSPTVYETEGTTYYVAFKTDTNTGLLPYVTFNIGTDGNVEQTPAKVTFASPLEFTYNGSEQVPTFVVHEGENGLGDEITSGVTVEYTKGGTKVEHPTDAGTYNYTVKADGYSIKSGATGSFTIKQKELTVTWGTLTFKDQVYDGGTSVTITGGSPTFDVAGLTPTLVAARVDKNVGNAVTVNVTITRIAGTGKDNYKLPATGLTGTGTVKVTPATYSYSGVTSKEVAIGTNTTTGVEITGVTVNGVNTETRTGKLTATGTWTSAAAGASETVEWTFVPTGTSDSASDSNYVTPFKVKNGTITAAGKTDKEANLTVPSDPVYSGSAVTGVRATVGDLSADKYEIQYKKQSEAETAYTTTVPTNVGDYTARVVFTGTNGNLYNMTGTTSKNFSIKPFALTPDKGTAAANNKPYDGNANATLTGQISVNKKGSDDVSIDMTKLKSVTFNDKNAADGKAVTAVVTSAALKGAAKDNYTITGDKNVSVGTANITPKAITITVSNGEKFYGQTVTYNINAGYTIPAGALVGGDTALGITLKSDGAGAGAVVKAGGYPITIGSKDNGNYTVTIDGSPVLTVNKTTPVVDQAIAATGIKTGDPVSKSTLTGTFKNPYLTTNAEVVGDLAWVNPTKTLTADSNEQWKFTPTGDKAANYEALGADSTRTVLVGVSAKAEPTLTVTSKTATYSKSSVAIDTPQTNSTGKVTIEYEIDGTWGETAPVNKGTYNVRVTVAETETYRSKTDATKTVTINAKEVTLKNTDAAVSNKTYDGTTGATYASGSIGLEGVISGDTVTVDAAGATYVFANANAADNVGVTATVGALGGADAGNYVLNNKSVAVNPANINAKAISITPKAQTKGYGAPFTFKNDGTEFDVDDATAFVGTDNAASLGVTLKSDDGAPATAVVGTYAITGSASNTNYAVTINGTDKLTVTPAEPKLDGTVTVGGVKAGGKVGDATISAKFVNPNNGEEVDGDIAWDTPDEELTLDPGQEEKTVSKGWTFTPKGEKAANYTTKQGNADIKVTDKEPADLTAEDKTVDYNGQPQEVEASTVNGGAITKVYKDEAGNALEGAPTNAGNYTVEITVAAKGEYASASKTVNLKINKLTPAGTVTASGITADQHLSDSVLTPSFTGLNDAAVPGTATWDAADKDTIVPVAGTEYDWTFTPEDDTNYEVVHGKSAVTVAGVTRTAEILAVYNIPNSETVKDYAYISMNGLRAGDFVTLYSDEALANAISDRVEVTTVTPDGKIKVELNADALKANEGGKIYAQIEGSSEKSEKEYVAEPDFTAAPNPLNLDKGKQGTVTLTTAEGYTLSGTTDTKWTVGNEDYAKLTDTQSKQATLEGVTSDSTTTLDISVFFVHPDPEATDKEIEVKKQINVKVAREYTGGGSGSGSQTYTVTFEAGANGKVDGNKTERVKLGKTPATNPEVVANEGFKFVGWALSADGEVVDPATQVVRKNTVFYAIYEEVGEKPPVVDPTEKFDHAAYIKGYEDGTFGPDRNITRAEAATLLARIDSIDLSKTYDVTFTDVNSEDGYAPYIGYMEKTGILKGYKDGTFRPGNAITRAEFATLIARYAELSEKGENIFSDVEDGFWATDSILAVQKAGLVEGYPNGTFRPEAKITRAEVVKILNGMLGRLIDESNLGEASYTTFDDVPETHWAYYQIIEAGNDHKYTKDNEKEIWVKE